MLLPPLIVGKLEDLGAPSLFGPISKDLLGVTGLLKKEVIQEIETLLQGALGTQVLEWTPPEDLLVGRDPNNRWRTVSCMQKAIRHGDVSMAMNAAHGAYGMDPTYLYRRLIVTAIEDVGLGNLYGTVLAHAAVGSKKWRDTVGDQKVATWLAGELAGRYKDRTACNFCLEVDLDPARIEWMNKHKHDGNGVLRSRAEDIAASWGARMEGAWLLAGTKRFWNINVPTDNDRPRWEFMKMCQESGMPLILYYLIETTMRRGGDCLGVSVYLMWEAIKRGDEFDVIDHTVPPYPMLGPLSAAAYDMHTREGKAAGMKFVKECAAVNKIMAGVTDYDTRRTLIGEGIFFVEGGVLAERLSYPTGDYLQEHSTTLVLRYFGLKDDALHEPFLAAIRDNLEQLHDCRKKVLHAAFYKGGK